VLLGKLLGVHVLLPLPKLPLRFFILLI